MNKTNYITIVNDHIRRVRAYIAYARFLLEQRSTEHDASKLTEPELSIFANHYEVLKSATYPSPEYDAASNAVKPAIDHHWYTNDHHPEYFDYAGDSKPSYGIEYMNCFQLIEMLCDWKAATETTPGGDIWKSIEYNCKHRFFVSESRYNLIVETAKAMGW